MYVLFVLASPKLHLFNSTSFAVACLLSGQVGQKLLKRRSGWSKVGQKITNLVKLVEIWLNWSSIGQVGQKLVKLAKSWSKVGQIGQIGQELVKLVKVGQAGQKVTNLVKLVKNLSSW